MQYGFSQTPKPPKLSQPPVFDQLPQNMPTFEEINTQSDEEPVDETTNQWGHPPRKFDDTLDLVGVCDRTKLPAEITMFLNTDGFWSKALIAASNQKVYCPDTASYKMWFYSY